MVTLGRISRISTRRAYVVADIEGHELVHETRDAGFYDPAPSPGDLLIRRADGTLSHKSAVSSAAPPAQPVAIGYGVPLADVADHPDNVAICGPARLNDSLDRLAQTLNERCREW